MPSSPKRLGKRSFIRKSTPLPSEAEEDEDEDDGDEVDEEDANDDEEDEEEDEEEEDATEAGGATEGKDEEDEDDEEEDEDESEEDEDEEVMETAESGQSDSDGRSQFATPTPTRRLTSSASSSVFGSTPMTSTAASGTRAIRARQLSLDNIDDDESLTEKLLNRSAKVRQDSVEVLSRGGSVSSRESSVVSSPQSKRSFGYCCTE